MSLTKEETLRRIAAMTGAAKPQGERSADGDEKARARDTLAKIKAGEVPLQGEAATSPDDMPADGAAGAGDADGKEPPGDAAGCEDADGADYTMAEIREEIDEGQEVLKRLALEYGGGVMWTSSAGTGKSVHSFQLSYCLAGGVPYFDITPARPLRVAVVQVEDSANIETITRRGMRHGLTDAGGDGWNPKPWTREQVAEAERRIHFWKPLGKRGADFVEWLRRKLATYAARGTPVDVVIVNPFIAFFDGDINSREAVDNFLYGQVDPVIKAQATRCCVVFFHHTPKPKQDQRGGKGYGEGYEEYAGAGSASLTDWPRLSFVFLKHRNAPGYYDFTAAKNGGRLGWRDADGKTVTKKLIKQSGNPELPYWIEVTDAEEAEAVASGAEAMKKADEETITMANAAAVVAVVLAEEPYFVDSGGLDAVAERLIVKRGANGKKVRGTPARAKRAAEYVKKNYAEISTPNGRLAKYTAPGGNGGTYYGSGDALAEVRQRQEGADARR